jgi:hypothetical protein
MRQKYVGNARAFSKQKTVALFLIEHLKQVPFGGSQEEYKNAFDFITLETSIIPSSVVILSCF